MTLPVAKVTSKGADRWVHGHPWIFRSDIIDAPGAAGPCRVLDRRGKFLGVALLSPRSEIRLRLLSSQDVVPDVAWWRERLSQCVDRRRNIDATACRRRGGLGKSL